MVYLDKETLIRAPKYLFHFQKAFAIFSSILYTESK